MRTNARKTFLILAALIVLSAAAVLLTGQIAKSHAREEAVSTLLGNDLLAVGNDTLSLTRAEAKAKRKWYSLSPGTAATIRITDMEQTVIVPAGDVSDIDITVRSDGKTVFFGKADQFSGFFPENGTYRFEAVCSVEGTAVTSKGEELNVKGTELFAAELIYDIPMQITFLSDHTKQGSVIPVTGSGVRGDVIISAGALAAPFPLITDGRGYAKGLFSVSYSTDPGTYTATIETEEGTREFRFTVEEEQYTVQHLTISEETQSSTVGNSDNRAAYNSMMKSTYESWYPERFYDSCFTLPAGGTVTTEFGLFRYTNDNPVPSRHAGVDIANEEGTPILAAASGYVIVADFNGVTGNTVVIDHGLGVRTYYYHMSELSVKQGEFVEEGREIGHMGSTGYATGPHLHFNVMVHDNSIDPWAAFDGTSGIFGID